MKRKPTEGITMRSPVSFAMPLLILLLFLSSIPVHAASIVINEFLAAPPGDISGDANGDGTRDSSEDEFVEIVNSLDTAINIAGWTLSDSTSVRHEFPSGTILDPQAGIVVFGGGSPAGLFGGAIVQTASSGGLGLNNGGDNITLNDGSVDQAVVAYGSEGGDGQSLTLDPDIVGSGFVKHSLATGSGGALFSPGTMINGTPFVTPIPIPGAVLLLGSGLAMLIGVKRKI